MAYPKNFFVGYDCAILFPQDGVLLGGFNFGFQRQLETRLCAYPGENRLVLKVYLQRR